MPWLLNEVVPMDGRIVTKRNSNASQVKQTKTRSGRGLFPLNVFISMDDIIMTKWKGKMSKASCSNQKQEVVERCSCLKVTWYI